MKKTKPNIGASVDLPQIDDEALATLAAFAHAAGDSDERLDTAIGDAPIGEAECEGEDAEDVAFDLTAFPFGGDEDETPGIDKPDGLAAPELELPTLSAADFALPLSESEGEEAELGNGDEAEEEDSEENAAISGVAERSPTPIDSAPPADEPDVEGDTLSLSTDDEEDAEEASATAFDPEITFAGIAQKDDDDGAEYEESEEVAGLDIDALPFAPNDLARPADEDESDAEALALSAEDIGEEDETSATAFDPEFAFAEAVACDEDDTVDLDEADAAEAHSTNEKADPVEIALPIFAEAGETSDEEPGLAGLLDHAALSCEAEEPADDPSDRDAEKLQYFSDNIVLQNKDFDRDGAAGSSDFTLDLPVAVEAPSDPDEEPDRRESAIAFALDALDASTFEESAELSVEAEAGDKASLELDEKTDEATGAAFAKIGDDGEEPGSQDFAAFSAPRASGRHSGLANHCSADRHLGLWAAEKLGQRTEDAQETYARSIVLAGIVTADASGGLEQVIADLASLGIHPETVRTRYDLILTSLGHEYKTQEHGTGGHDVFAAP